MAAKQFSSFPAVATGLTPASAASAWGFGSWVEVTASTSSELFIRGIQFQFQTSPPVADTTYETIFEIGTGAGGAETTKIQIPYSFRADTITSANNGLGYWYDRPYTVFLPEPMTIASGTRIAVRCADYSTSALTYGGVKILYQTNSPGSDNYLPGKGNREYTVPNFEFTGVSGEGRDLEYNFQLSANSDVGIMYDTSTTSGMVSAGSITVSHVIANKNDRFLLACYAARGAAYCTGVTYSGSAMTKLNEGTLGSDEKVEIWYMDDPPVGTANIVATMSGTQTAALCGVSYYNVASVATGGTGSGSAVTSVTVTGTNTQNDVVVNWVGLQTGGTTPTFDPKARFLQGNNNVNMGFGLQDQIAPLTNASSIWTFSSNYIYALSAVLSPALTLNKFSASDSGFTNFDNGSDTHPFTQGQRIRYVPSAISAGTYYWRVRSYEPSGTGVYGDWGPIYTVIIGTTQDRNFPLWL